MKKIAPKDLYKCPLKKCDVYHGTKRENMQHYLHDYHCEKCGSGITSLMGVQIKSWCVACEFMRGTSIPARIKQFV